jgi:uncharacterized protein YpiB (UPF0302 family)
MRTRGGIHQRNKNLKIWNLLLDYLILNESMMNLGVNSLGNQQINAAQTSLLSKGLKFIPTPKITSRTFSDIHASFSNFTRRIKLRYFFRNKKDNNDFDSKFHVKSLFTPNTPEIDSYLEKLRNSFKEMIDMTVKFQHQSKQIDENLTEKEKSEIQKLRKSTQVMVQASDKNLGLILFPKSWYISECYRQLNDKLVYQLIPEEKTEGLLYDLRLQCKNLCQKVKNIPQYLKHSAKNHSREARATISQ